MLAFLSSTVVSLALIAAAFFAGGLTAGYLIKNEENVSKARLALFWWFCASLLFYFALACVISRKVLKETLLYSVSSTITFQEVPAFAGLFCSVSCLFLMALLFVPWLRKMFEEPAFMKKAGGVSVLVSAAGSAVSFFAVRILPIDLVWGGIHYFIPGIFSFSCFFMLGLWAAKKIPYLKCGWVSYAKKAEGIGTKIFHKHPAFWYILFYTAGFACIAVLSFSLQIAKETGFIWEVDAKPQYIPYMRYTVQYLQDMFSDLLHGGFTLKMYDFTIGMGEDVRSVLRMRPLEFLAAFFSAEKTTKLYSVLIVVRYYMAGLSFSLYARYRQLPWFNILVGSMVYVFSGYTLNYGTKHPVFMAPMILLPLLLLGMERLIEKKDCLFFCLTVGISLFINYYFLYMSTVALGVYALIRFPQIHKENRGKEFAGMMGRIIGYYLVGCGMAMFSFLPTAIRTLSSERVGNTKIAADSLFTYGDFQAARVFLSSISSRYHAPGIIYLSFAIILIPVLVVLFVRPWKEYWGLKLSLLLEIAGLLIPAVGLAMSALSSITNRWVYIVTFTSAFVVACMVDKLYQMTKMQLAVLCVTTVLYGLCYHLLGKYTSKSAEDIWISFRFLIGITVIMLVIHLLKTMTRRQSLVVLSFCTALSLGFHGRYLFDNPYAPFYKEFISDEKMEEFFQKEEFLHLTKIEDDGFYRCDTSTMRDFYENSGMVYGYNGTSVYNSVINSSLVKYHLEMESSGISAVHRVYSLDGRTAMEALADVKYYLAPVGKEKTVPYGYEKSEAFSYGEFDVYENQYPLSIGYTYDSLISRSDYERLSALERQQIMLSAAVVEDENRDILPEHSLDTEGILTAEPEFVSKNPSVSINGSHYSFPEPDTGFTISYNRKAGYETYLRLENLETKSSRAKIVVTTPEMTKNLIARDNNQLYSLGRNDYLLNLGYSEADGKDYIHFSFTVKGEYDLDKLEIYYVPMDDYISEVQERNAEALEDVSIGTNTISGTVTVSSDKLMSFSIPYSKGFTAYVDGQKTELLKVNTAYMGVPLKQGKHDIRLVYRTPGLRIGIYVSAVSVLGFLLMLGLKIRIRFKNEEV